jgi:hypothetical protein
VNFNVNVNVILNKIYSASIVENEKHFDTIKMRGTTMKIITYQCLGL